MQSTFTKLVCIPIALQQTTQNIPSSSKASLFQSPAQNPQNHHKNLPPSSSSAIQSLPSSGKLIAMAASVHDNKMNVRRLKKKKCLPLASNEEERAKDRLFQISYFQDEKYFDESHFLTTDPRFHDAELHKQKRTQEMERLIRNKHLEEKPILPPESRGGSRQGEVRRRQFDKCIFNLLQSNSVFVGIKDAVPSSPDKEMIVIGSRKRMQTMPELKERQSTQGLKVRTEESEGTIRQAFLTSYQKFPRVGGSLSKRNYSKLRQHLRYDLFVKSLNCTLRSQQ